MHPCIALVLQPSEDQSLPIDCSSNFHLSSDRDTVKDHPASSGMPCSSMPFFPAVVGFLIRDYRYKSVGTQIPRLASISYTLPHQDRNSTISHSARAVISLKLRQVYSMTILYLTYPPSVYFIEKRKYYD